MKTFIKRLRDGDAVVLDTETTGLNNRAEVLQIGIVSLEGETLFNSLLKPARARRWDEAMDIHGIAPADVQDAPSMAELSAELQAILDGRVVAIYNADFDARMLWQSVRANAADHQFRWMGSQDWQCVMKAYAKYFGQRNRRYGSYRWQTLSNACRQQGITVVDAHDAVGDARLTAALIRRVEEKLGGGGSARQ